MNIEQIERCRSSYRDIFEILSEIEYLCRDDEDLITIFGKNWLQS
jgi:hypothetical protein